jgi:hypothetical protein
VQDQSKPLLLMLLQPYIPLPATSTAGPSEQLAAPASHTMSVNLGHEQLLLLLAKQLHNQSPVGARAGKVQRTCIVMRTRDASE